MKKLNIEDVKKIPELINNQGYDVAGVAEELGVSKSTVGRWIQRLRMANIEVKVKKGPKAMKL